MGFFNKDLKKAVKIQAQIIEDQFKYIMKLEGKLYKCLISNQPKAHGVHLAIAFIINNSNIVTMNDVSVDQGKTAIGTLWLIDDVTGNPVDGSVVFSGTVVQNDSDAVATISLQPNGTLLATPIAPGTTHFVVNSIAAFTDSLGSPATSAETAEGIVTVVAVQTADGVHLEIRWTIQ